MLLHCQRVVSKFTCETFAFPLLMHSSSFYCIASSMETTECNFAFGKTKIGASHIFVLKLWEFLPDSSPHMKFGQFCRYNVQWATVLVNLSTNSPNVFYNELSVTKGKSFIFWAIEARMYGCAFKVESDPFIDRVCTRTSIYWVPKQFFSQIQLLRSDLRAITYSDWVFNQFIHQFRKDHEYHYVYSNRTNSLWIFFLLITKTC